MRYDELLNRATRSAGPDGPLRNAVCLNEMLLQHHKGLALKHRIAMLLINELGRVQEREPSGEVEIRQNRCDLIDALIVLGACAAAECDSETTIPTLRG